MSESKLKAIAAVAALLVTALSSRGAHAESAGSMAPNGAEALVSGLSARRTAQNEAQARQPEEQSTQNASATEGTSLPSLDPRLELSAGSDHLLDSATFLSQTSIFAEGRYRTSEWLQLGASAALRVQGNGNGNADLAAQLLFGPTFNLGVESGGLENAFFISPKLGPTVAHTSVEGSSSTSETRLAVELTLGKRFALGKSFAFAPAVGEVWQSGYKPTVLVQPLALSVFF